ncbi:hypothetical protein LEMA_P072800.1 [Plenodomus lingam JN3]|uniref:Uncharacterized protein n=1 Tax=Leptosphaeria maculans (strain JN3 / isolate v23.1.3 / race Av1-4-5-6-7-8) TaxID=985895 RepID=E4ZJI1_LEPMJ|nr:hypothetical protein LEMA_P072800.1 [Plenodomus lingam JN3]CBX91772.1 hypothetical protein LEMA_P072800.1 [Plenodomus lingam JN3]
MLSQDFFLLGEAETSARTVRANEDISFEDLQDLIASRFAFVVSKGIGFVRDDATLSHIRDIFSSEVPIGITIDGSSVREVPGPKGKPYVGKFFEVFPDHLGNHQRLFEKYGPAFKTTNLGGTLFHTNDPDIAGVALAENDFFTKDIFPSHPLYGIKNQEAGVFLGDTDTPEWRIAHKFLPPALGPKAVRHCT